MERTIPGKYAIAAILALAAAAVGGGTWYRIRVQARPADLWGRDAVALMLNAPRVTALRLAPPVPGEATEPTVRLAGTDWIIVQETGDISGMPDLLYVRRALADDSSFDWAAEAGEGQPLWEYGLRFSQAGRQATVVFAPSRKRAMLIESGASASMPYVMPGIEKFLREQLASHFPSRDSAASTSR